VSTPRLRIEPLGVAKRDGTRWRTTWRITNMDSDAVRVLGAIAPHSQFRGDASLDREVRSKASTQVSLTVETAGAAGSEIENAFLILLVQQGDERWRVLTRLRVSLDAEGRPRSRVETVTMQRVGFSGEL
jgi:hypothetical protein